MPMKVLIICDKMSQIIYVNHSIGFSDGTWSDQSKGPRPSLRRGYLKWGRAKDIQ